MSTSFSAERGRPVGFRIAGLILLFFGLLPIANWIPGGHDAPWYADRLQEWISGGAIVLGVGLIGGMAIRRYPAIWREGLWSGVAARWRRGGLAADLILALLVLLLCAVVAQLIFSAKPLLIDEIIQVFQARVFASGRLWLPAPAHPEFTSAMHLLDWNGKVYGQFPAGGPALLAIGTLLHGEWLVGPVFGAIGVFLFARLLRRIESRDGTAFAALLLFALSPFVVFLGGSYMNHVTTTTFLLGAALALSHATADENGHPLAALWCGLALGIAATIRPMDGAVFALPAGAWLLWRARQGRRHLGALLLSGLGIVLPLAALLMVNAAQTGDPFRFGYIEMWGKTHELGFHEAPWGPAHTPMRGLELINLYLLRLQTWLFEAPGPSLLFATAALLLVRRPRSFDRWMLAACGGLLLAYFAYWHDGFYLGPRFMLPLAPWLILWTARLPAILAERGFALPLRGGVTIGGVTALIIGFAVFVPIRGTQYRNGMLSMRVDPDQLTAAKGIRNAIILVRESWGGQLMTRMWGVGVSRVDAEHIYHSTDACYLDAMLANAEATGGGGSEIVTGSLRVRGDSVRLRTLGASPDSTLKVLPGAPYSARCQRRLMEDNAGFALYTPMLLARGDNLFVLDLHALDSLIINAHPERAVWLFTKPPHVGADPILAPVSLDSARAEWRLGASGTPH